MDLIDRQAAIDAIFSEPLYESGMKKRDTDAVVPAIYEKIKSLPSAQPEDTFEFGKWYDFKRGYVLETTVYSFRILKDVEASSNG